MGSQSLPVHRFLRKEIYDFHEHLVTLLDVQTTDRVLDAGCGRGATLLHLGDRLAGSGKVVGVDVDENSLAECRILLGNAPVELVQHDLDRPLPFVDHAFTKIVCHNVVECIVDKAAFLAECFRVLAPGGLMVLSHSDFDSMVFNSQLTDLTRRLVHCFADAKQPWMTASDGLMGRKLAPLVALSPFSVEKVEGYTVISTDLATNSPGEAFLATVLAAARKAEGFTKEELETWENEQRGLAVRGEFLYAVTNYIVVARRLA